MALSVPGFFFKDTSSVSLVPKGGSLLELTRNLRTPKRLQPSPVALCHARFDLL